MDSIATGAFNGTPLKSITFPASLTKLSEHNYNMFRNISTLTEVIVEGSTPLVLTYSEENNPDASIFNTVLSTATLKVTGEDNIPAYQAAAVWQDFASVTLGLDTLKELSFSAYPNPTTDYLNFSSKEVSSVDIYNILGAKVSSQKIINNADMTQLNKGIYFIKAKNIDGLEFKTIKVIKQ